MVSCLAAMRFWLLGLGLLSQAAPALADPNWLYLGGSGEGVNRVAISIDLNSSRLLPNGVTSYSWKIDTPNPITLENTVIDLSWGIDCKTLENVALATGARTPIEREKIANPEFKSPAVVAARNFCTPSQLKAQKK